MSPDRYDDPFEVFEPWSQGPESAPAGGDAKLPGESGVPRWRQRHAAPAEAPSETDPEPDPDQDPVAYLRAVALPLILADLRRLESKGHAGLLQDLLELIPPSLRFLFWPRPSVGPRTEARPRSTLEIRLGEADGLRVIIAHARRGGEDQAATFLGQVPTWSLTPEWIRARVVEFVKDALERA